MLPPTSTMTFLRLAAHCCNNTDIKPETPFKLKYHNISLTESLWNRVDDDVIEWKHFPRYCPFVQGIHRSPVNSSHKGQWRGALMFSLICAWTNSWANNGDAGDLWRHRAHCDAIVMHGSTTAVFCTEFQKDSSTMKNVVETRNIARFQIKTDSRQLVYIVMGTWVPFQYPVRRLS